MSTIALDYPTSLPVSRHANIRWMVIIVASILVATVILLSAVVSVRVDSTSGVVAVPVPAPAVVEVTAHSIATATPASSPMVIAVPVATPPAP